MKNILPKLNQGDATLLKGFIRRTEKQMSGTVFGGRFKEPIPITFESLQGTISALRSLERRIVRGTTTNIEQKVVKDLRRALVKDRDAFLEQHPLMKVKVDEAEVLVRQVKDDLDRSVLADIAKVTKGREVVVDERVFEKVIRPNNVTQSSVVARVLREPRGNVTPERQLLLDETLVQYRRGILDLYRRKVIIPEGRPNAGTVDPKKHAEFLRQFDETIEPFFSPQAMTQIRQLDGLPRVMRDLAARRERIMNLASKTYPAQIANLSSPTDAYRLAWRQGDKGTMKQFMTLAEKDPDLLNQFRGVIHQDLTAAITDNPSSRNMVFDYGKLSKWLRENSDKAEVAFEGTEFVANLRTFNRMLGITQGKDIIPFVPEVVRTKGRTALDIAVRAYYGLLSKRGRQITAIRMLRGKTAERAFARATADAQNMARLMELRRLPAKSLAATTILSELGATVLTEGEDLEVRRPVKPRKANLFPFGATFQGP